MSTITSKTYTEKEMDGLLKLKNTAELRTMKLKTIYATNVITNR